MPVQEEPGYDDWGYAKRNVRGSTTSISNHASGTAEDLNATQHPRGVKGTFSKAEKAKIHAYLEDNFTDPVTGKVVIRWGEDYAGTIDGMHFEINADADAVKRVADKLRERENEDMALSKDDKLRVGPGNSAILGQTDGEVTVEEALVGTWASSVMTNNLLREIKNQNTQLLALLSKSEEK